MLSQAGMAGFEVSVANHLTIKLSFISRALAWRK
jgi:hypothetical protein